MRLCPSCHGERDECEDADKVWHMRRDVCHKTVALRAAQYAHAEEYKAKPWHDGTFTRWNDKQTDDFPNHFMDGVTIWVADTPDPKLQSAED